MHPKFLLHDYSQSKNMNKIYHFNECKFNCSTNIQRPKSNYYKIIKKKKKLEQAMCHDAVLW